MTDQPKRGKRVQIYLPADLVEQWERTPRYERSATVAAALRAWWERRPDQAVGSVVGSTPQKSAE